MLEEAQNEQAWQDLLAQLEKYHPEEIAAIDRVAAERERARHSPISADDLRRHPNPWHGDELLLCTLRLSNLRRKGYVDLPSNLSDDARKIDDDFHMPGPLPRPTPDVTDDAYSRIHPIWRWKNWATDTITPEEYTAITPALELASCMLSEPTVLTFLTGLIEEVRILDRPDVIAEYNDDWLNFTKVDRLFHFGAQLGPYDAATLLRTWRNLWIMRRFVQWTFTHGFEGDGETYQANGSGFTKDKTSNNAISIQDDFLAGIRYVSKLKERGYPVKAKINEFWHLRTGTSFNQPSADMRRQFFLAVTILHELAHAVWNSVHERFPDVETSTDIGHEPFYGDQHIAELGFALEQAIFGGKIDPNGPPDRHAPCPYGLQISDYPGISAAVYVAPYTAELGSALDHGIHYGRIAPIKATEYLKYFKKRF